MINESPRIGAFPINHFAIKNASQEDLKLRNNTEQQKHKYRRGKRNGNEFQTAIQQWIQHFGGLLGTGPSIFCVLLLLPFARCRGQKMAR